MTSTLYVPILKWKQGEQGAIKEMSSEEKTHLLPLIEILPPSTRKETTDQDHMNKSILAITNSWGNNPFFLDVMSWYHTVDSDVHPYEVVLNSLRGTTLFPIFVASLVLDQNECKILKKLLKKDSEIALRLTVDVLVSNNLEKQINLFLKNVKKTPDLTHLILDLQFITPQQRLLLPREIITIMNELPYAQDWKSITLAGTSFPDNLGGLKKNTLTQIPRVAWSVWRILTQQTDGYQINFADYGVSGVRPPIEYEAFMGRSANIRFTSTNHWLVFKGESLLGKKGFSQYRDLSKELISNEAYLGKDFSWGDLFIFKCATEEDSQTGNQTTWRKVGTSHHIAFVLQQLANLP
jgi:hypothetical protein